MEVSKLREDFLNKLQKEEYISNYLFENIKNTIPDIIPVNFNLDNYNNKVLDKEYIKYKEYFDTMYNDIDPEIHLDEEQIKAILSDEEYSLILAGAGTGKTTTMASCRYQKSKSIKNISDELYKEGYSRIRKKNSYRFWNTC